MTQDEIIAMAKEAGFGNYAYEAATTFERFAALVAAKEREACAQLISERFIPSLPLDYISAKLAAIRARGTKEGV